MSSTSGLRTGDHANELARLRRLLARWRRRAAWLEHSRDYWRQRARAAEYANRNRKDTP